MADVLARSRLLARVLGDLDGPPAACATELERCADDMEAAGRELLAARGRSHPAR